ncbi:MAG: hypothetical protein Q9195_009197 [Heterodermia aff. obscurata]
METEYNPTEALLDMYGKPVTTRLYADLSKKHYTELTARTRYTEHLTKVYKWQNQQASGPRYVRLHGISTRSIAFLIQDPERPKISKFLTVFQVLTSRRHLEASAIDAPATTLSGFGPFPNDVCKLHATASSFDEVMTTHLISAWIVALLNACVHYINQRGQV